MRRLLLIDGNSLLYRAYHALPPLTDRQGQPANAVFGFANMIIKAIGEIKPTHIACAFDTAAPTFRHIEFEKYKAQRPPPPPDLYPQLPKVKAVLDAFGIKYFEEEGFEADDLIATIASKCQISSFKFQVIILSGDRDVLQLVNGNVKVQAPGWNLKETTLYGAKEVKEKFGLEPYQIVDYKSLIGDPSDNVPGIAGIGPKTASQLLSKYHTLENLFKQVDNDPVSLGSIADKLKQGKETALAAKRLVELDCNVDIEIAVKSLEFRPHWEQVRHIFEDLGFKSIVAKLPGAKNTSEVQSAKTHNQKQLELV